MCLKIKSNRALVDIIQEPMHCRLIVRDADLGGHHDNNHYQLQGVWPNVYKGLDEFLRSTNVPIVESRKQDECAEIIVPAAAFKTARSVVSAYQRQLAREQREKQYQLV